MTMTTKQINARINKAIKATTGSNEAIQEALFATIEHAYAHGDVSLLNRLFAELPEGIQFEKLKQYAFATAPIRMNKAEKQETSGLFAYKAVKDEDEVQAKKGILSSINWYNYKPRDSDKPKAETPTATIFANTLKAMVKKLQAHTDLNDSEQKALKALEEAVKSRLG